MGKRVRFISICFLAISILFIGVPGASMAKTTVLKFAHPYSPMHPQHKEVLVPWAEKVMAASNGTLKIKFIPGGALGKPGQVYAMVEKGVADIGWDIADYSPGRFPLTTVIELPFMVTTAEKASVALWKTYEKFPEFQKEYADTKLLMLSCHAPGVFTSVKKPIESLKDLKGMKIKTASSFTTGALKLFGAVPVTQPITETYTSLERGVLDGAVMPYDGVVVFKLNELLKYYTPANFYSMVFWVSMNKDKFAKLPDAAKKAIEENSGLPFSKAHGISFDGSYARMKEICIKTGMKEVKFSDREMKKLIGITDPLKDQWVKDMEAKGLPGKAVLKTAIAFSNE